MQESEQLETFAGATAQLAEAIAIMARLRALNGCPWDREQTFDTIKKYTLEETYEVFDAIERRNWPDLKDELGDLLLQVLFYAQIAADAGYFNIADVAANLNAKLVRRHPHVFGNVDAANSNAVLRHWEQIKREEKAAKQSDGERLASLLDDVPRTMPATLEAHKLGSRAAKAGFDWPDAHGLFAKMEEELEELKVEVEAGDADRTEAEFGDLLFTAINLARHLRVDAETALRRTNAKFRARFTAMEQAAGSRGLADCTLPRMEELWLKAKAAEGGTEISESGAMASEGSAA